MFRSCSVLNCASKRKDVKLFKFPKRQIGLQKWLDCINCEELRNKRAEDLCKRFVCQKHFQQKFIISTRTGRTRLHVDAYPTLFSDSEISSGTPKTLYMDHTDIVASGHTYTRKKEHQDHTYFLLESMRKYERILTEIDAENKENEKDQNKENEYDVNKEHKSEAIKEHVDEENKETEEEEADITSFENTDLVDYITTWTDDMPTTSGCVNEATINPIRKDAVITSTVPSAPKLKVGRHVDSNKPSKNTQPKKGKKSSLNCATTVIKSLRQLKHCHKTARKVNLSKTRSFKKVTDRMDPLAKDIMWMLIRQCTRKGLSTEEKHNALSTLKQVQSVTESCINFLSSQEKK